MLIFRHLSLLVAAVLLTLGSATVANAQLNSQEQRIVSLMSNASGQKRPFLQVDPILSKVARARATDMAKRHYFAHVNPDGHGPNYLVRQAGYTLPAGYDQSAGGNNIESCDAGDATADGAWNALMGSPAHKTHLLAQDSFYANQTSVGVGYYYDASSPYWSYWVIITAPPPGPTLAISSPAANAGLTTPQLTASGTSGGAPAASKVTWRLENSAGTTAYAATTGTASWSASVANLVPGPNTIRVQSLSSTGAVLLEQTRTFRYVVMKPLTVAVEGTGSVTTGFLGTTQRELGARYTITAKAASGYIFDHWSGTNATTAAFTFTMAEGLAFTANFRPNPFYSLKGAYNGLIQNEDAADHATSGFLKATVANTGAFSGRLTLAGKNYVLTGKFDTDGAAQVTIKRSLLAPLVVTLQIDLNGGTQHITGSVTDGTFVTQISADQALPAGSHHFAAGRYTVALPANQEDTGAQYPQGNGYGLLTVSATGAATLTGTLADGRTFTAAATVSKDGSLPIYVSLLSGTGSLAGSATFNPETGALTGDVLWTKPERLKDPRFSTAFATDLPVIGSRYVAPLAGTPVIDVTAAQNNSALQLEGGDLVTDVDQSATLLPTNVVSIVDPVLPKLALKITASTGRFTGSFTHPVTGVTSKINGVVLQDRNAAAGFFLGQTESGAALFTPAE